MVRFLAVMRLKVRVLQRQPLSYGRGDEEAKAKAMGVTKSSFLLAELGW
jgi:hypothetical protein